MKTKFLFKSMLVAIFAMASLAWTSCSKYDDDIAYLQDQIDTNAEKIAENAAAIASIENLISNGSVITNVGSNSAGTGVIVTLSDGSYFEITNGTNGKDGNDADVWTIGPDGYWYKNGECQYLVAIGADGDDADVWTIVGGYWYCNGEPTEYVAVGTSTSITVVDGYWVIDGVPTNWAVGSNGSNGLDGNDGADGNWYGLEKDEESGEYYWFVYSYTTNEDGETVVVSENTGVKVNYSEDAVTAVLDENGVLTLTGVEGYEGGLVLGLSSIANLYFIPELIVDGVNAFSINVLGDGYLDTAAGEVFSWVLSATSQVSYRVNPTNYVTTDNDWSMVARTVEYVNTKATGDMAIFTAAYNADDSETGVATLDVNVADLDTYFELELEANERIIATAQVTPANSGTVSSDYAYVTNAVYTPGINVEVDADDDIILVDEASAPAASSPVDIIVYYDPDVPGEFTKTIDLDEIVAAYASADREIYNPFASYGFDKDEVYFTFENVNYLATDGDDATDQSIYVTINDDNELLPAKTNSMVNRTPVVLVKMITIGDEEDATDDNIIAQGYIKFKVLYKVAEEEEEEEPARSHVLVDIYDSGVFISELDAGFDPTKNLVDDTQDRFEFDYADLFGDSSTDEPASILIDWTDMTNVYEALHLSNSEYLSYYGFNNVSQGTLTATTSYVVDTNNGESFVVYESNDDEEMSSVVVGYTFNYLMEFGDNSTYLTLTPEDLDIPAVTYRFNFSVNEVNYTPTILENYKVSGTDYDVDVVEVDGQIITRNGVSGYEMSSYIGEVFNYGKSGSFRDNFAGSFDGDEAWSKGKINLAQFGLYDTTDKTSALEYQIDLADVTINGAQTDVDPRGYYYDDLDVIVGTAQFEGLLLKMPTLDVDFVDYSMVFSTQYPNGETNNFNFVVRFVNPLSMTAPASINFIDYNLVQPDTRNVGEYISAYMLTETIYKEGDLVEKYETDTTFGDFSSAAYGLTYTLGNVSTEYELFSKDSSDAKDDSFTWNRGAGAKLNYISEVAEITVKFTTPFAVISTDAITVNVVPEALLDAE